ALVTSTPSRVMKKPLPSASGWSRSSSAISVTTEGRFSRAILAATGSCSCAAAGAVTGSIVASARPATTPTRRAEDIDRIARRVGRAGSARLPRAAHTEVPMLEETDRQVDNARTRVTRHRLAPGAHTGLHRHEHDYVVVPVTAGRMRIVEGSKESLADLASGV